MWTFRQGKQPQGSRKREDTAVESVSRAERRRSRREFEKRPDWEALEEYARVKLQGWLQDLLEEEITDLVGRRKSKPPLGGGCAGGLPERTREGSSGFDFDDVGDAQGDAAAGARIRAALRESDFALVRSPDEGGRGAVAAALASRADAGATSSSRFGGFWARRLRFRPPRSRAFGRSGSLSSRSGRASGWTSSRWCTPGPMGCT
ncbi:MAG: hypothetical protein KatS3mg077_2879 [Candidatus Binatia bacterium]|nr:MAG: hypothetical protein KatS3mg077_2879 [Candidatus Binatia bacterium]